MEDIRMCGGWVLTSKINGSSIFLPAAGYNDEGTLESVGSYGGYWSSTLYTNDPNDAKSTSATLVASTRTAAFADTMDGPFALFWVSKFVFA